MDNKNFALSLASCESEEETIKILKEKGLWDNSAYWRPFGDIENNWSTIGNQQSEAEAALVEKIVNSIDAMLMKECLTRGISPESPQAPKSIAEAMEQYFKIKGGKLQDITPSERTKLAKSIILAATGDKTYPCFTIVDRGEGQTPNKMPDTILSISKSNKLKVPFVQGKFNMGGTGIFRFCGNCGLQLIISKRCPEIHNTTADNSFSKWGFTVIRRERPKDGDERRSSMITYLVGNDNEVFSFLADNGIAVIPSSNGKNEVMNYGMYCKMYEYRLSPGLSSNINMRFYNRLSMLLPNLAYPVYLDECRNFSGHSKFRTLSGLNVRLSDQSDGSDASNIEETLSASFNIDGQKISIAVFVFKKTTKKGNDLDMSQFRADEGILLTQNGQTHGNFDRRFYQRTSVGLSYIADHILTIVDCSQINEATREDLFMNSRDRMSAGSFGKKLERCLEEFLKENDMLKRIQARRREEAISNKLDDAKPLEDVLSSVFKSSSVLSKLFILGERLQNPTNLGDVPTSEKFIGKYNPTYFTINKKPSIDILKREVQIDRKFRISFKTDAVNDFFSREEYPGEYLLYCNESLCENHGFNLHNGTAVLSVFLPEDVYVGQIYHYKCIIIDTNVDRTFENEFEITIIPFAERDGGGKKRILPPGLNSDEKTSAPKGIALPNVTEVTKDGWDEHNFTKESALDVKRVSADSDAFDFFINMENVHLQTEIKPFAKDESKMKLFKSRYKYAMVLIGLSILGYYSNKDEEDTPEDKVRVFSEMISPIILPMIDRLGSDLSDT